MPIGNVTSQIFSNIYLNELDYFIKHRLKAKNYFRYADDFIIIHQNWEYLKKIILPIKDYLLQELGLELHPRKVEIRKFSQGIDFLGYVVLPYYNVLRTKTKRRIFKKLVQRKTMFLVGEITEKSFNQLIQSYLGVLKHCEGHEINKKIQQIIENKGK